MATISGSKFFGGAPGEVVVPGSQAPIQPETPKEPSLRERIVQDYQRRGEAVVSDVNRPAELMSQGASPLKVAGAVGEAGLRTVGNVIGAAFDPIAEFLSPAIKPIVQKIAQIPGVSGGVQAASDWATKHPEAAKDLGAVFNIATLPFGGAAEMGAKGALEASARATGKAISPVGKVFKGLGEASYGLTVPMEESTSRALLTHQAEQGSFFSRMKGALGGEVKGVKPITEANTAARMGLMGTEREIGIQAKQFQGKLWEELGPKLDAAKNVTDMRKFIGELGTDIKNITPELGRRNSLLEALQAFAEDYIKVGSVGGTKLNEYKSGWAKVVPEATYKGKPIGSALRIWQPLKLGVSCMKLLGQNQNSLLLTTTT